MSELGGEESAEVGHRQHAVGDHVFEAGFTGRIEVDVEWIVIA